MRDSQRSKVWSALHATFRDQDEYQPKEMWEVKDYIENVIVKSPDKHLPSIIDIDFKDGRGRSYMGSWWTDDYEAIVTVPRDQRNDWQLLVIVAWLSIRPEDPWHGWHFCQNLLWFVKKFLGREWQNKLQKEFIARRVRYKEPRKREMTDEQREAARQRMQRLHLKRELESGDWNVGARLEKMLDE